MPRQTLSPDLISAAIEGFEAQKRRIDQQIAELRQMLDGRHRGPAAASETPKPASGRKRRMSAAGRRAISEATKKRWAEFHAAREAAERPGAKKTAPNRTPRKKAAAKKAPAVAKKTTTTRPAPAPEEAAG